LQLPARGNAAASGANAAGVRPSNPRLLPPRLHNALLRGKIIARFATRAGSREDRRPEPVFASHARHFALDPAGKSGGFNFFRSRAVFDGGWRSAFRAELRPAPLIVSFQRP